MLVENTAHTYLHLLVFQCPQCGDPISVPMLSEVRSLEQADGTTCKLACSCGYSREVLGIQARRHYVEPWPRLHEHDQSHAEGLKARVQAETKKKIDRPDQARLD